MATILSLVFCLLLGGAPVSKEVTPDKLTTFTHPKLDMTVLEAEFRLPPQRWKLLDTRIEGLSQLQLSAEFDEDMVLGGEQVLESRQRRASKESRQKLSYLYSNLTRIHAQELQGNARQRILTSIPWTNWQDRDIKGPFYFVIPDRKASYPQAFYDAGLAAEPLALELRPFIDDSKHHVLYTNGTVRRVPIDKELVGKYELAIVPVFKSDDPDLGGDKARSREIRMATMQSSQKLMSLYGVIQMEQQSRDFHTQIIENSRKQVDKILNTNPWADLGQESLQGPFFFLIPDRQVGLSRGQEQAITGQPDLATRTSEPLALELRPYIGDGKHNVLYTDGQVRRVPIDAGLVARHTLTISPIFERDELLAPSTGRKPFTLYALRSSSGADAPSQATVRLRSLSGDVVALRLDLTAAAAGDEGVFQRWCQNRFSSWADYVVLAPSTVFPHWLDRAETLYGGKVTESVARRWNQRNRGRSTSILNVLGGRAAIRETLQLQSIAGRQDGDEDASISVSEISGVQVESHPYAEMLGDAPGGRLPLAELVPHDRFMVYFSKPSALARYLDGGSRFLFDAGRALTESSLEYDLAERYFRRLGLSVEAVKLFLKSNAVADMVLVFPDLFFIDGTDVTAVMNVPQFTLAQPLLKLLGLDGLDTGDVVAKELAGGQSAYWALREHHLLISTSRAELDRVLALERSGGEGSLGRSAEFRYMLSKLPVRESTTAYAYLSDPFIRRLVGPEVKIAQLRRLRARAALESLSAGALLYRHDGHSADPNIETLVQLGYVPAAVAKRDFHLGSDLVAHSERYGTPSAMATVTELAVDRVTTEEARVYKTYVNNYTQFWRQFFDPIAVRLDDHGEGEHELGVFILPLIQSSVYEMVREIVASHGDGVRLRVPDLKPEPVLLFSVNLNREAVAKRLDDLGQMLEKIGAGPEVLGELGPSVHFAILDSDPVINLGSGDVLGAFGGGGGGSFLFRNSQMFMIPLALSALTRPCKLFIELQNEDHVRQYLRGLSIWTPPLSRDTSYSLVGIDGEDRWILTLNFFQLIKLRMGIEVRDGFLVISNLPWHRTSHMQGLRDDVLSSACLRIVPGGATLQLPGLHAAAREKERLAVFRSAAHLQALILAGAGAPDQAQLWHRELFGFMPTHPGTGDWKLQGERVVSSVYGAPDRQQQPAHGAGDRQFGLLRVIEDLTVSMQLEDDGLRTRLRWTVSKP